MSRPDPSDDRPACYVCSAESDGDPSRIPPLCARCAEDVDRAARRARDAVERDRAG